MTPAIPGYKITAQLYESIKSLIFLAVRETDQLTVVIKTPKDDYPSHQEVARYQHEYTIQKSLLGKKGVAEIYSLEHYANKPALIMEYIAGGSLAALFTEAKLDDVIELFFNVATQIALAIGEIHEQFIIHKDINPRNILWEPKTESIKIIDFGIATELSREEQSQNTQLLKGSLPYISPEQTGRMNRAIDYRSDFYSLGVTLYTLLTGEFPFDVDDDPMTWIHCHIAKQPKPITGFDPAISLAFSAIIRKLMAKNAEDRYQSALGLKSDLDICWTQWQETGVVSDFVPGMHDVPERFEIPQKLYGREQEVADLLEAFSETVADESKMFLVSGYSGVGKSALIHEVHKPIVAKKGFFIDGKFDQFQRNIPYSAISKAFKGLMKQLLIEPANRLQWWQEELLAALGSNGQVIIDIIPDLEQIIGLQPEVPHLGTEENQNRFNHLFLKFLRLFTRKECPLVLFIDDLQWVDSASLNLIKLFMLSKDHAHFLFIGAYRDNEVDAQHPFIIAVDELKKAGVKATNLILKPLQIEHINQLITDTVYADPKLTLPLARLVLDKTAGNPFFVNQFLKSIFESGLLTFNVSHNQWQWNLEKIELQQSSENVVDLMVAKMTRLPQATQDLLRLGACIGNEFDLQTLSIISEQTPVQTAKELWPAVKAGLLITEGEEHSLLTNSAESTSEAQENSIAAIDRFLHDRVQQAAYSMIDESQKQQVHLKIGRLLLRKTPEAQMDNAYFDIVGHYNKSIALIEDEKERLMLAELNLVVGKKAKEATAYAPALQYFSVGANCMQNAILEQHHRLFFDLEKGQIECHFLLGKVAAGLKQAEAILKKCTNNEDKVALNNILILYYGGAGEMDKAIDIALASLHYYSVEIPRHPNKVQLLLELAKAKINLGRKSTDTLLNMPRFEQQDIHIVFSLLKELIAPTYLQGLTNLLPYIILRMFNLTLKYGNGPVASFTYSGYALLWSKLDDFAEAYRFGVLAMESNKTINNPPMEARCYFMTSSFAMYWGQPFKESQEPRKTGLQKLLDTGEYFWSSYIYLFGFWQEVVLSKSIDELFILTKREIQFAKKANQIEPQHVHTLHRNLFKNLAGEVLQTESLDTEPGEEAKALAYFERNKTSTMGKFYHVVCRLVLHYYHEEFAQAVQYATRSDMTEDVIRDGTYTRVIFAFYSCLSILAIGTDNSQSGNAAKRYKNYKQKIQQWYQIFPENFACMWYLILAEEARNAGQENKAIDCYEKAQQAATKNESLLFESLVKELYAKFWIKRGNQQVAAVFMTEAGYLYYRWGAVGKLKLLQTHYASLFIQQKSMPAELSETTQTTGTWQGTHSTIITNREDSSLDLNTLAKASQTLSGEIVMEKLIEKLMHFLIENAGAQTGILILQEQGDLFIEAACSVEQGEEVLSQQKVALDDATNLSITVVRFVARSKEIMVMGDAKQNIDFASDTYLQQANIKSVLCLPLMNNEKLFGILYLENNLATHTFTPDRVEILQVLSSEIVIALQNAHLYRTLEAANQTLEDKVEERTKVLRSMNDALLSKNQEIQETKKIIEEKSSNITKSIRYAQKIQAAMLPQSAKIAELLPGFFIIFKPKQIVSGDFYWFNKIDDKIFIVVADCTGHGVPGAFLSMIGHMLLNKIINEDKIDSPALILEHLHLEIRAALRQEGKSRQANDGMDIGICQIDLNHQVLVYAAARRPLYLIRTTGSNNSMSKIRGDRKSIGGRQKEQRRNFTDHFLAFSPGDTLYLTSDGFVDQHNKQDQKFGSKKLEDTLTNIARKDIGTQKKLIQEALIAHQGNELQRDDITMIGVKL